MSQRTNMPQRLDNQRRLLEASADGRERTVTDYANLLKMPEEDVRRDLNVLTRNGQMHREALRDDRRYQIYRRKDQ